MPLLPACYSCTGTGRPSTKFSSRASTAKGTKFTSHRILPLRVYTAVLLNLAFTVQCVALARLIYRTAAAAGGRSPTAAPGHQRRIGTLLHLQAARDGWSIRKMAGARKALWGATCSASMPHSKSQRRHCGAYLSLCLPLRVASIGNRSTSAAKVAVTSTWAPRTGSLEEAVALSCATPGWHMEQQCIPDAKRVRLSDVAVSTGSPAAAADIPDSAALMQPCSPVATTAVEHERDKATSIDGRGPWYGRVHGWVKVWLDEDGDSADRQTGNAALRIGTEVRVCSPHAQMLHGHCTADGGSSRPWAAVENFYADVVQSLKVPTERAIPADMELDADAHTDGMPTSRFKLLCGDSATKTTTTSVECSELWATGRGPSLKQFEERQLGAIKKKNPRINYCVGIAYYGKAFDCFAWEPGRRSVLAALQEAIIQSKGGKGSGPVLSSAGRTDRSVHAIGQVVSFHSAVLLNPDALAAAVEPIPGLAIWAPLRRCPKSFHATFGAKWRRYVYTLPLVESELSAAGGSDSGGRALAEAANSLLNPLLGKEVCYDAFARQTPPGRFEGTSGRAKAVCILRVAKVSFVRLPVVASTTRSSGVPVLRFELVADRFLRRMVRVLVSTTLWLVFLRLGLDKVSHSMPIGFGLSLLLKCTQ
eukprot:SAG31_NODE_87_length_26728_cov_40.161591_14_plen_648_part_00